MSKLNRQEQKKAKRKKLLRQRQAQSAPPTDASEHALTKIPPAVPGVGVPLTVIPEDAEGLKGLHMGGGGGMPVIFGHDHDAPDYLCGKCGYRLLHAIAPEKDEQLKDGAVLCPECKSWNALTPRTVGAAVAGDQSEPRG